MNAVIRVSAAVAAVALAGTGPAGAAEFNKNITVEGVTLGKTLMGPEVTPADMKGRVVLLEFWGINCPPCIASLPHMAKLNSELGPAGLVLIGAHAQNGTEAQVLARARAGGVNYTIVEHARVAGGQDFNGIPHVMLFDHTGKCIYRGFPDGAYPLAREAVAKAPAGILEGRQLVKLARLGADLKRGVAPGTVLRTAKGLVAAPDSLTAEEAAYVVEKINAAADRRLATAKAGREKDPAACWAALAAVGKEFAGTDQAKEAAALTAELRKDKAFQAELKAAEVLAGIRRAEGALPPAENVNSPEYRSANAGPLRQILGGVQLLRKTAPDSPYTRQASEIARRYGLIND